MILLVHGGAGEKRPIKRAMRNLSESLHAGYGVLQRNGSALDAVVESIRILEDSGIFNAGAGGNLQLDGVRRLDASVMEGRHLKAGSVIGVEGVRNPLAAARALMDLPHVMLTNVGAVPIARTAGIPPLPPPDRGAMNRLERAKQREKELVRLYDGHFSTVGAVAMDRSGCLAAGASTGGLPVMLPGRVGDTPIIGAGIYAENSLGAVSCTGMGESIIRLSLAKEICMNMKTASPYRAASASLRRILDIGGQAGIISINRNGRFAMVHTTEHMISGYADNSGVSVKEGFRRILPAARRKR